MKVSTRDVLADLIVKALDDAATASTLRGLVASARTCGAGPRPPALDEGLRAALPPDCDSEWPAIRAKLIQYEAALDAWSGKAATETCPEPSQRAGASALEGVLQKSVVLFNHQLFFEVHEVLEPQWMKEQGEVKRFLQGLIQIAVAFYHLGRSNLAGSRSLLHEGLIKIAPHSPAFLGVELRDFIAGLETCREVVSGLRPETSGQFSTDLIPRMRLIASFLLVYCHAS